MKCLLLMSFQEIIRLKIRSGGLFNGGSSTLPFIQHEENCAVFDSFIDLSSCHTSSLQSLHTQDHQYLASLNDKRSESVIY